MADREAVAAVRRYRERLVEAGIPTRGVVLYGSAIDRALGEWSDIDVLVVLDDSIPGAEIDRIEDELWRLARDVDSRIEPLAVSENDWLNDDVTPIIIVIREKGLPVTA